MKLKNIHRVGRKSRSGFSLVEATFSIGILSCGFLTLVPLLAMGLKATGLSRSDRASAQIAETLVEEAKLGTLPAGTVYLDDQGAPCSRNRAAFTAQSTTDASAAPLTRLTLRVAPAGAPDRARIYAVVFQAPN